MKLSHCFFSILILLCGQMRASFYQDSRLPQSWQSIPVSFVSPVPLAPCLGFPTHLPSHMYNALIQAGVSLNGIGCVQVTAPVERVSTVELPSVPVKRALSISAPSFVPQEKRHDGIRELPVVQKKEENSRLLEIAQREPEPVMVEPVLSAEQDVSLTEIFSEPVTPVTPEQAASSTFEPKKTKKPVSVKTISNERALAALKAKDDTEEKLALLAMQKLMVKEAAQEEATVKTNVHKKKKKKSKAVLPALVGVTFSQEDEEIMAQAAAEKVASVESPTKEKELSPREARTLRKEKLHMLKALNDLTKESKILERLQEIQKKTHAKKEQEQKVIDKDNPFGKMVWLSLMETYFSDVVFMEKQAYKEEFKRNLDAAYVLKPFDACYFEIYFINEGCHPLVDECFNTEEHHKDDCGCKRVIELCTKNFEYLNFDSREEAATLFLQNAERKVLYAQYLSCGWGVKKNEKEAQRLMDKFVNDFKTADTDFETNLRRIDKRLASIKSKKVTHHKVIMDLMDYFLINKKCGTPELGDYCKVKIMEELARAKEAGAPDANYLEIVVILRGCHRDYPEGGSDRLQAMQTLLVGDPYVRSRVLFMDSLHRGHGISRDEARAEILSQDPEMKKEYAATLLDVNYFRGERSDVSVNILF